MQKKFELGRMDIVDLYDWFKNGKIEPGPYFQRFSVWKELDRAEFVDTIMNGFPIPSIFICEGEMNLQTLKNTYYVLDGRQRLESIFNFIDNQFEYNGKLFSQFDIEEKKRFLNFSIPIIQVYLDKTNEVLFKEGLVEIFKRLNKNSYNLNKIEKQTSQYSEYDFIKICKMICKFNSFDIKELKLLKEIEDEIKDEDEDEISVIEDIKSDDEIRSLEFKVANISEIYTNYQKNKKSIFSPYQKTRQVNMQHLINLIASIDQGIINRNLNIDETIKYSQEEFINGKLVGILLKLDEVCNFLIKVYDNSKLDTWWISMSNLYTLAYVIYMKELYKTKSVEEIVDLLMEFKENDEKFKDYNMYCQNSVNDKSTRIKRNELIEKIFEPTV